jgi:hypothetical protein
VSPTLFPLPVLSMPSSPKSSSARVRQRYALARCATMLVYHSVSTLNHLYGSSDIPVSSVSVELASSAQLRILAHLYRVCKRFVCFSREANRTSSNSNTGSGSDGRNNCSSSQFDVSSVPVDVILTKFLSCVSVSPSVSITSQAAGTSSQYSNSFSSFHPSISSNFDVRQQPKLFDSGSSHVSSSYFGVDPSMGAIPIIAERVSLPAQLSSVPLVSLLPPTLASVYEKPTSVLLTDQVGDVEQVPVRFFGRPSEYLKLLLRMRKLNMIDFTSTPKAVNGLFGVPKDDGEIRLIIDATPANRLFIPCPPVSLPDPTCLARLSVHSGDELWMAKTDLESFYHQLVLPKWLQNYFALPGFRAEELVEADLVPPGKYEPGTIVYPMCTTLPMGWSHSVMVGQSAHENVAYSHGDLNPADNIVYVSSPLIDRPLHGLIVDDAGILSNRKDTCEATLTQLMNAYSKVGLQVKWTKLRLPSTEPMQFLGMLVGGRELVIRLPIDKLRRLTCMTIDLLRSDLVTGTQLQKVIGLWTWQLMLARPALSVLHYSYRYMRILDDREGILWPSVRSELVSLLSLLPLLQLSLSDTWHQRLIATDASEYAAGVVTTSLSHSLFCLLWPLTASRHTLHSQITGLVRVRQDPYVEHVDPESFSLDSYNLVQPAVALTRSDIDSERMRMYTDAFRYLELVSSPSVQWHTMISSRWRWAQHINSLELQSVIIALKRLLTSPAVPEHRILLLCDSAVVAYTLTKGRSSAASLVRGMKKIAALLLGSGCRIGVAWIPTQINPADKPSRAMVTARGGIG